MDLAQESLKKMFPEYDYNIELKYSGKLKGFNGNIRRRANDITLTLSRNWQAVSKDIQAGIIQELMLKLFKRRQKTLEIDLYHNFLRTVHTEIPKTDQHPVLKDSFNRINQMYFNNQMEMPNLLLKEGRRVLGFYDYGRDQISISNLLLHDQELLDYVMYHEMLHKHFKFQKSGNRTLHHSKEFRDAEKKFPNAKLLEKKLSRLGRNWFTKWL